VWRQEQAPLCKYIIQRIAAGKGFRWLLYQWQPDCENFVLVPFSVQQQTFPRLYRAHERAAWLERLDQRAGNKPDHSSPIEAAAALFAEGIVQNGTEE